MLSWNGSRILRGVKRLLLSAVILACSQQPIGTPAGSNNYDDPDDPGSPGMNGGSPEGGDANGQACVAPRDCPAAFLCAYPVANMCAATGRCIPYTAPTDGCDAAVACGCDNSAVQLCAPSGYAPHAVQSTSPCDAGAGD